MNLRIWTEKKKEDTTLLRLVEGCGYVSLVICDQDGKICNRILRITPHGTLVRLTGFGATGFQTDKLGRIEFEQ